MSYSPANNAHMWQQGQGGAPSHGNQNMDRNSLQPNYGNGNIGGDNRNSLQPQQQPVYVPYRPPQPAAEMDGGAGGGYGPVAQRQELPGDASRPGNVSRNF
jgi:hypothetical protein